MKLKRVIISFIILVGIVGTFAINGNVEAQKTADAASKIKLVPLAKDSVSVFRINGKHVVLPSSVLSVSVGYDEGQQQCCQRLSDGCACMSDSEGDCSGCNDNFTDGSGAAQVQGLQ